MKNMKPKKDGNANTIIETKNDSIKNLCENTTKKRGRPIKISGFSIDPNQFYVVDKKETAYFLGFLWADGSVRKSGYSNRVEIEIKEPDAISVKNHFMKLGKWNMQIRKRSQKVSKYNSVKFCCNNRPLTDHLIKFDYKTKSTSSPTKILSTIPEKLKNYFWRGYLDGDGCIYLTKNRNSKKINGLRINFWGTHNQDWSDLIELCNKMKCPYTIYKYKRKTKLGKIHKSSTLYINNPESRKLFLDYIYSGEKIGLKRKRSKYESYIKI